MAAAAINGMNSPLCCWLASVASWALTDPTPPNAVPQLRALTTRSRATDEPLNAGRFFRRSEDAQVRDLVGAIVVDEASSSQRARTRSGADCGATDRYRSEVTRPAG